MKHTQARLFLVAMILLCALAPAWSVSMIPNYSIPQPFDSELMLSQWDFDAPVAPSQQEFTNNSTVSLVTIGPGDPLYAWFGHTSLVVAPPQQTPVMFDYGIFDFKRDHFYRNFALGRLYYSVMGSYSPWRIAQAIEEERDVKEQVLDLPPQAKLAVIEFLNSNIRPENNTYLYHHFNDNCSTRIRDIINHATDGAFKQWATSIPASGTFRQIVMRHTIQNPIVDWGLNFLQSGRIDGQITLWEEMFLPEALSEAVAAFSWKWPDGTVHPLIMETVTLNDVSAMDVRPAVREETPSVFLPTLAVGLFMGLFGLFLLWLYRRNLAKGHGYRWVRSVFGIYNFIVCLAVGVLSSVLLFMMTASTHDVTWFNENILFANPWLLVMAVSSFAIAVSMRRSIHFLQCGFRFLSAMACVVLLFKGIFPSFFVQANYPIIALLLPYYALQGWIIRFAPSRKQEITA